MNWLEWCCAPFLKRINLNTDVSAVHIVPTPGGWEVLTPPIEIPSLVSCALAEIAPDTDMETCSLEPSRQERV